MTTNTSLFLYLGCRNSHGAPNWPPIFYAICTLAIAKKAVIFFALVHVERCSNLAALNRNHMCCTPESAEFTTWRGILCLQEKHFILASLVNSKVCPVSALCLYIKKTADQVRNFGNPKLLFISS